MTKNISTIIELWSKVSIKSIQDDLDEKVIEIAQQLEEGDASRKLLVEKTKEFRKSLNDDQRKLVGPILKLFQVEVDSWTKRSKQMEQILLKLYQQLIELPDTTPLVDNLKRLIKKSERCQDLETENKQLKLRIDEYIQEFSEVKNQEVTIKLLKEKIKEQDEKSEQYVQQRLKEKEKELQRFYIDKEQNYKIEINEMINRLNDADSINQTLKTQLNLVKNDLNEFKLKQEELLNAKTSEIDLLLLDLDKMTERAVNAERLVEQYTTMLNEEKQINHLDQIDSTNKFNDVKKENDNLILKNTSSLEMELASKEKELTQLVDDIQKLQAKLNKTRENYEHKQSQLEEKLNAREKALELIENELKCKQDYDEIKRELNILKSIEFNMISTPSISQSTSIETKTSDGTTLVTNSFGAPIETTNDQDQQINKPLEILLIEKNRYLLNENTFIKNKLNDLQQSLDTITTNYNNLNESNSKQKELIAQLEKDLTNLANSNNNKEQAKMEEARLVGGGGGGGGVILDIEPTGPASTSSVLSANNNDLFNIVVSQRERFRVRIQELENENQLSKEKYFNLSNQIDMIKLDNMKLIEKIKYLQSTNSLRSKSPPTSSAASRLRTSLSDDPNKQVIQMNQSDDTNDFVFNKYSNEYETNLDPFNSFKYKEKQTRYSNLKLHEKFLFNFSKFILSNRITRIFFCIYFFLIHLLIFINLYGLAHRQANIRDLSALCAHSYKEHMAKEHGLDGFQPPI